MKLELKHIQHYPIGGENALRVLVEKGGEKNIYSLGAIEENQFSFYGFDLDLRFLEDGYLNRHFLSDLISEANLEDVPFSIKPILRPMSDLCKPLEDGTIPIVVTFRMFGIYHDNIHVTNCGLKYDDGAEWLLFDWSYSDQSFIDSDGNIYLNMESITYLFSHHFDIYNLISQDLAIDINTIEQ